MRKRSELQGVGGNVEIGRSCLSCQKVAVMYVGTLIKTIHEINRYLGYFPSFPRRKKRGKGVRQ